MNRNRLSDVLLALIPAAAAILLHGPLLDWDLKIGDEGYLVYGVERLAEGEVLYRDVLLDVVDLCEDESASVCEIIDSSFYFFPNLLGCC